jgi:hypothetical protein
MNKGHDYREAEVWSRNDPHIKSRLMPLLIRAGIDAFPGASDMSTEEWFRHYDLVLDSVC